MKQVFYSILFLMAMSGCSHSETNEAISSQIQESNAQNPSVASNNPSSDGNDGLSNENLDDITSGFKSLLAAYGIPGAQIAITRNEKLVYSAAFGLADASKNIPVNESSLFRIAGISKALTLMALSKLVADKKLKLDEFVLGPGAVLGTQYGTLPYEPLEETIQVSHLLEHTAGFIDEPYDIMFDAVSLSHGDLIGKVLDERSLAYVPGTTYAYSNFGYCVLGRIIERISGMTYEAFVQEQILAPMNTTDMKIGGSTQEEVLPKEVRYYSHWRPPYAMNIGRMDAHGGWIASAKSLAFIAVQSDAHGSVPDLFSLGEGLDYLKNGQWNQNGALPGSIAVMQVGYPICYVVLLNEGDADFQKMIQTLRNFMNDKVNKRTNWPNIDLFDYY
jgi:CubicO group peptidase (beta-lactamase class C family)